MARTISGWRVAAIVVVCFIGSCVGVMRYETRLRPAGSERSATFYVLADDHGKPDVVNIGPRMRQPAPIHLDDAQHPLRDNPSLERAAAALMGEHPQWHLRAHVDGGRVALTANFDDYDYESFYDLRDEVIVPIAYRHVEMRDGAAAFCVSVLVALLALAGSMFYYRLGTVDNVRRVPK